MNTAVTRRGEQYIYRTILIVLSLPFLGIFSLPGLGLFRYIVYAIPLMVLALAMLGRCLAPRLPRELWAMLLMILLGVLSMADGDLNTFKKVAFIGAYTSAFLLVDFSRAELDLRWMSLTFVALVAYGYLVSGGDVSQRGAVEFSVLESRSSFENTLAFPLALLGVFFLVKRRYVLALLHLVVVVLALKRSALLGLLVATAVWFLPTFLRRLVVNPLLVAAVCAGIIVLCIGFAQGQFDRFFIDTFSQSANQFTQGRQSLWSTALAAVSFRWEDFALFGVGVGRVTSLLATEMQLDRVLLHNDLLSLALETGFLAMLAFVLLLMWQSTTEKRILAVTLLVMFMTDNVLIYQHVMLPYFLVMAQLARDDRPAELAAPAPVAAQPLYPNIMR